MNNYEKKLWWCAGADIDLLEQSYASDRHKFTAIGASILLTTACAILSGGYAFYVIFKSFPMALLLGFFWGLIIFNLDRSMILAFHKEKVVTFEQMAIVASRIFVAVLIAVVIAKPLELKIFEKPILAELAQENALIALQVQNQITEGMPEIRQLQAANQALENSIQEKENKRDQLCDQAIKEAEGISGTGKEGKGPVYAEKNTICQKQETELEELKEKSNPILAENRQRINTLQAEKDQQFKMVKNARENADDIITQLNTLENLAKKNPAIAHASHAISWLFIVVDTAPIFAKILAKRSPYDAMLKQKEQELIENADQEVNNIKERVYQTKKFELDVYLQSMVKAYQSSEMTEIMEEIASEIIKKTKQQLLKQVKQFQVSRQVKQTIAQQQKSTLSQMQNAETQLQNTQNAANHHVANATQQLKNYVSRF